jgi:hypothetical protein
MSIENLPPEMQQRIASIIQQAQVPQEAEPATVKVPAPPIKAPSLMDHTIALRQEVAALSQQLQAIGQVVEATGQATGALYQMFHEQTTATNQGATYETEAPDF